MPKTLLKWFPQENHIQRRRIFINIHDTKQLRIHKQPEVILEDNQNTHPICYQKRLYNIQEKILYSHIYTYGSKDNNRIVCGAVLNNTIVRKFLLKETSIFITGITVIDLAL